MVFIPTGQGSPPSSAPTSVTMGGDVTGTSTDAEVVKLRGRGLSAAAPTNGQALIYTSTSGLWVPGTVAAPTPVVPGSEFRTGFWYPWPGGSTGVTLGSKGRIWYGLFVVNKAHTFPTVGIYITGGTGSGRTVRLGLFADSGQLRPGALLHDWGTVSAATIGARTITVTAALTPGIYWRAVVAQGSSATVCQTAREGDSPITVSYLGTTQLTAGSAAGIFYSYLTTGSTFTGAFPATAPTALTTSTLGSPAMQFQA